VDGFEVATAIRAARRLTRARRAVAVALVLLFAGTALTWWAPAPRPAFLKVTHGSGTTCGVLLSADGGKVRLSVAGRAGPVEIPLTSVDSMAVTGACP
jgi:hypothetical protein